MKDSSSDFALVRNEPNGVTSLTLNRPHRYNALSLEMMKALKFELERISDDPSVKVLIIKGSGRGFCAGHDLKEIRENPDRRFYDELMTECRNLMQGIQAIPQPVIAQVHGVATAAGCQLVATCDLAVAANDAKFSTPGVNIGLFCTTPMIALARNIQRKRALEMLLTGDMISAEEALHAGLINRSVDPAQLEAVTYELASKIASKPRFTIALGKKAFYAQAEMPTSAAYLFASEVMVENLLAQDAKEGISAFLEKKAP